MDLYEELRAVLEAIDAAGIPYALVGGLAVSIYTVPRATEDIDIASRPVTWTASRRPSPRSGFGLPDDQ